MNACARLAIPSLIAAAAHAQTGTYTWQVSIDNGATWSSNAVAASGQLVKVRLRAGWSGVNSTFEAYVGGQFDAMVIGADAQTRVSNIVRPVPFAFSYQSLVASIYAQGIKIDTIADTALPGAGTGWINPGQALDLWPPGGGNRDNPATVFTYDIVMDDSPLALRMFLNPTAGRAMAVYTSMSGTMVRISASSVTINEAYIVPSVAPLAAFATLGFSIAIVHRRRHP